MNVEQFAQELKLPPQLLLEQLKAAGVHKNDVVDSVTEADKAHLLDYLRKMHGGGAETGKTKITITRKQTGEIRKTDSTGKSRTIQVEVRKSRTYVKRDAAALAAEAQPVAEPAAEAQPVQQVEVQAQPVIETAVEAPAPERVAEPVVAKPVEVEPAPAEAAPVEPAVAEAAPAPHVLLETLCYHAQQAAEKGLKAEEIAQIVRESDITVLRWLKRYLAEGIEGLKLGEREPAADQHRDRTRLGHIAHEHGPNDPVS